MKRISDIPPLWSEAQLARIERALRYGNDAPTPTPEPAKPLTLESVRAGATAHQKAIRAAKGAERSAALAEARKFADQVVEFAGASEDLDLACEMAFSIGPLLIATDHAEQTALAEL